MRNKNKYKILVTTSVDSYIEFESDKDYSADSED